MSSENVAAALPPQELDQWFLDLLECPGCDRHRPLHLTEAKDALHCDCGRYAYPVRDGIPILLVEEAQLRDASIEPGGVDKGGDA